MARPKGDRAATERRKDEMVEAAFEAFSKDGYNGASLKAIADAVGVTEAALLHHYHSKAGLMWTVLEHRDNKTLEKFQELNAKGVHPVLIWLEIIKENVRNRGIVELFSKLSTEATNPTHPAHSYFMRRHFLVQDSIHEIFQGVKDQGFLKPDHRPAELALELAALSDGLQIAWLMNPGTDMVALQKNFFKDCMTEEGIRAIFK